MSIQIGSRTESPVQLPMVKNIYEGGDMDMVFELYETRTRFYINRGLGRGLSIDPLWDPCKGSGNYYQVCKSPDSSGYRQRYDPSFRIRISKQDHLL